jgi:hypothetical protein
MQASNHPRDFTAICFASGDFFYVVFSFITLVRKKDFGRSSVTYID